MNMLYTHDHEPESLKMLRQALELFPQANQCITAHTRKQQTAQPTVVNRTEGTQAGAPAARMEVIWAGREDDKNNRIVCVLMSYTESTLNAYTARVIDQGGKEIAVSSFVSFERDIAFATMLVPIDIFDECSAQMYFPSAGVITIQGVELQDADMDLSLWDAAKGKKVECSTPKKLHVEDSVITYCFAEKWEGKKLSDCYDLGRSNTNVKYLLTVKALEKTGKSIELTITNEAFILGVEKDEARKHEIPEITVYLDCFAEGTLIRMADGTEKKVEDICSGDLIRTPSGEAVPIRMAQRQEDCQVIGIDLENGRSLAVTDGHAICRCGRRASSIPAASGAGSGYRGRSG